MSSKSTEKVTKIINRCILPFLLVIACFWNVNRGLDLADTGYNLERYYNYFAYPASSRLSKFWSDYIGHLLMKMPGGDTWLGMSIYCTLVIVTIVLVAYYFCSVFLNNYVVFICEIMAVFLYWIPAIVLYDSLSFLLLEVAVVLLYFALKGDNSKLFLVAGIVLGVNTLVRMPNITYIILILWVWLYAWLYRERIKKDGKMPWVVSRTLVCLGGYLIGLGGSFLYSLQFGGVDAYFKTVSNLSGNTKVGGYTLGEMAFGAIIYIFKQAKYMILIGLVIVVAIVLLRCLNQKQWKYVIYSFVTAAIVGILYGAYCIDGLFTFDYSQYSSIKGLMGIVYLWGIIVCIINVIWKRTNEEVIVALLYMSILWITPLGSNNGIYLDIANSFLLFPMIFYLTKVFFAKLREREFLNERLEISSVMKLVISLMCVFILLQITLFGVTFSFNDSSIDTKVEAKCLAYGMRTSSEKATALTGLLTFLEEENIEYSSLIQYCDSPGLYYLLQTKRGIPHSWPELDTCTLEKLTVELEEAKLMEELPMIIMTDEMAAFYQKIYLCEDVYIDSETEVELFYDEKVRELMDFMSASHYKLIYNDESMYGVYTSHR